MHYVKGRERRKPALGCIQALGSYLPSVILANSDLAAAFDVSEDWIFSRTGIRERRLAAPGQYTSDLAVEAAKAAFERGGISAAEITHLLLATCTPDGLVPSTACILAGRLGIASIPAFDFNAACTGFLYGLHLGAAILRLEPAAKILLVAAETMSSLCDPGERNISILFGDGASAVVLGNTLRPGLVLEDILLASDGAQGHLLTADGGGCRAAYASPESRVGEAYFLRMQGREVFKHAVRRMGEACENLLLRNGLTRDDIDLFVPHQANLRIMEATGERLGLGAGKTVVDLEYTGNTSAASIPLALCRAEREGRLKPGSTVLLAGFGGGFTWGAALLRMAGNKA